MLFRSHGKGVIKCHRYEGSINGEKFSEFVTAHFPEMFNEGNNVKGSLFLQDGDPSQNSKLAMNAMDAIPCRLFKIPARSPDLNPIENFFHSVGKELRKNTRENNITKETYAQFCWRVKKTLMDYPVEGINKTIGSMNRRIDAVIKAKGERTKY